jgi:flagellar hook-associated protein 3 FlgL
MKRISSQLPTYDSQYWLRLREWYLNEASNRMSSQTRINNLRDDPMAASRSVRYQSEILRTDRYISNAGSVRDTYAVAEGYLRSAMDVLQRIRELAVEGANGTNDRSQMGYIGQEVDQLLGELLTIGNAQDQNGNYLFAGLRSQTRPFRTAEGRVPGGASDVVVSVDYLGNGASNTVEISEDRDVEANFPGNFAFWAENQQIYSTVDASRYQVQTDSRISIDGTVIALSTGDTVSAVIARINDSGAPVRARLDPVDNSLVLETTRSHQIQAEDLDGGTVLSDLGILARGTSARTPQNIAPSARVFGGSLFDMVIQLRDALFEGSTDKVGSSGLRGIDSAISNLSGTLADLGAKDNRVETAGKRLEWVKPQLVSADSEARDLDLSQAVTELKMLEYGHEAALAAAARVLPQTLLDFLR